MINQTPQFTFSTPHQSNRKTFTQRSSTKRNPSFYFSKEILTIDEYNDKIAHSQNDLKYLQYKLDKEFFKEELKATLYLNYQLIKLCSIQEHQLNKLRQEITFSSKKMKMSQKKEDFDYCAQTQEKENINLNAFNSFGSTPFKSCQTYEFEQSQIINNSLNKPACKQCSKIIQHKQEMLHASNQQNEYLRSELIKITQKLTLFSLKNTRQINQNSCQTTISQKNNDLKLKMMNCSPIRNNMKLQDIEEVQISFNNDCFDQNDHQINHISEELQSMRKELSTLHEEHQKCKKENNQLRQDEIRIKVQYQQLFSKMSQQYNEIKTQLQERLLDVEKYQKMLVQIKEISKISRNYKEQKTILQQQIRRYKQENIQMQTKYNELKFAFDMKDIEDKSLRQSFNKILRFLINQSNQWKDLFEEINNSKIK